MRKFNLLFFFLSISAAIFSAEYRFEGRFNKHEDARLKTIALFLSHNPRIIIRNEIDPTAEQQCLQKWKHATICSSSETSCDFLWVEKEGSELETLACFANNKELKVIYTSTHFQRGNSHYHRVREYLESIGFILLSHWYWENEKGNAIFVKRELCDAAMRGLNYFGHGQIRSVPVGDEDAFKAHLKKAENKESLPSLPGIDFTYMINLDQRPEKFSLASCELNRYGIFPYRFSAVNGWELPITTIRAVGVPFSKQMTSETFMGTVFREIDGEECVGNELIKKEGEVYFALELTRGAIGILFSHVSALQDAYDSGYPTTWVMEDDVEVLEDPMEISYCIAELDRIDPEWDILFTDPDTKDTQGNTVICRSIAARPNFEAPPLSELLKNFYNVSDRLTRTGMRYGAYSMILRRPAIKKILDHFKTYHFFLPYDMEFWLIPGMKMYCPKRAIISHRPASLTDNNVPNYKNKE